jgi:hypothetical protein
VEALVEKYLGLPTALGRSTDELFKHIVAHIKKLVNGYVCKKMSSASREIVVKAICEAIPTYLISCFRLSKKMCKNITSVVSRFGGEELNKRRRFTGSGAISLFQK